MCSLAEWLEHCASKDDVTAAFYNMPALYMADESVQVTRAQAGNTCTYTIKFLSNRGQSSVHFRNTVVSGFQLISCAILFWAEHLAMLYLQRILVCVCAMCTLMSQVTYIADEGDKFHVSTTPCGDRTLHPQCVAAFVLIPTSLKKKLCKFQQKKCKFVQRKTT